MDGRTDGGKVHTAFSLFRPSLRLSIRSLSFSRPRGVSEAALRQASMPYFTIEYPGFGWPKNSLSSTIKARHMLKLLPTQIYACCSSLHHFLQSKVRGADETFLLVPSPLRCGEAPSSSPFPLPLVPYFIFTLQKEIGLTVQPSPSIL